MTSIILLQIIVNLLHLLCLQIIAHKKVIDLCHVQRVLLGLC